MTKALERCLIGENVRAPCSLLDHATHIQATCSADVSEETNPVVSYLTNGPQPAWTQRPHWEGGPGHSAMKPRLRNMESWRKQPLPTLKWTCRMCEAEFPNKILLGKHIDLLHGQYRFYSTWLGGVDSLSPYVVSPIEKRAGI